MRTRLSNINRLRVITYDASLGKATLRCRSVQGGLSMDSAMKLTFFFSLAAFSVFFADLLWHRIRLGRLQAKVDAMRIEAFSKEM